MERISSRQNPLVKRFRALARPRGTEDQVLLDGEHLVAEALRSHVPLEVAAFSERAARDHLDALARGVKSAGVKTLLVSDPVLAAISPVQHPSGVVAIARRTPATLEQVLQRAPQLVLMISDVQDPGNVGAIVRAAEACGATGIIAGTGSADPFGWKALRGAMGSTFRLPVAERQGLVAAAARVRRSGIRLLAMVPRGGASLGTVDLRAPSAILLGSEGGGLPSDLMAGADQQLTIPMHPPVESLNVAIAAAIVLYEASRQRQSA